MLFRSASFLWVWEDFLDASRGRGQGLSGPEPLNHEKLFYWQRNRGIRATSWEITVLLSIDETYLAELTTPEVSTDEGTKDG